MTFLLPKRTRTLWQIRIIIIFILLCAIIALLGRYSRWFLLPAAIVATLGLAAAFVYIPFYFNSYKIRVDESSISISKGIIIKTTNIMPFPRLVFAESVTSPIASLMRLRCVLLKAARGWILIPEIENENAEFLLNNLRVRPND